MFFGSFFSIVGVDAVKILYETIETVQLNPSYLDGKSLL